jgi:hypothetical protein
MEVARALCLNQSDVCLVASGPLSVPVLERLSLRGIEGSQRGLLDEFLAVIRLVSAFTLARKNQLAVVEERIVELDVFIALRATKRYRVNRRHGDLPLFTFVISHTPKNNKYSFAVIFI